MHMVSTYSIQLLLKRDYKFNKEKYKETTRNNNINNILDVILQVWGRKYVFDRKC